MLLEDKNARVVICQPRRIAAKSLADRIRLVEPSIKDKVALRMGHGVREGENINTRVWFMTAGYLVRFLAGNSKFFDNITHLIIDEVHERSAETDLLCLLAKRLLSKNKSIRLILMSATVAADMYAQYFDMKQPPIFVGARCHDIKEYYIEDLDKLLNLSNREALSVHDIGEKCQALIKSNSAPNAHYMEKINDLAIQVVLSVVNERSSALIFVPGISSIVSIFEKVERLVIPGIKYKCVAIHSDIPFDDQMMAFDPVKAGEIKIIVATNAAESSLTLPDVDHVICTGEILSSFILSLFVLISHLIVCPS